jgi:hypothetical protein
MKLSQSILRAWFDGFLERELDVLLLDFLSLPSLALKIMDVLVPKVKSKWDEAEGIDEIKDVKFISVTGERDVERLSIGIFEPVDLVLQAPLKYLQSKNIPIDSRIKFKTKQDELFKVVRVSIQFSSWVIFSLRKEL